MIVGRLVKCFQEINRDFRRSAEIRFAGGYLTPIDLCIDEPHGEGLTRLPKS